VLESRNNFDITHRGIVMNYPLVFNFYGSSNYSRSGLLGLLALLTALLSGCASEPTLMSSDTSSDTDQYAYRRSAPYNKPYKVRVTNLHNGRSIDVVVNDRGPFKKNRLIDLSHGAAKKLGVKGMAEVKVEYLSNKVNSVD
jgi:hypothetical protein